MRHMVLGSDVATVQDEGEMALDSTPACPQDPIDSIVDVAELAAFGGGGGILDALNMIPSVLGSLAETNRTGLASIAQAGKGGKGGKGAAAGASAGGKGGKGGAGASAGASGSGAAASASTSSRGLLGSACQGHPQQVMVPYRCHPGNLKNCDLGGCASGHKNTGAVMVRAQPVGPQFLFANQAWGGVHVTVADFGKYRDPVGMFEKVRKQLDSEYNIDWFPKNPETITKDCKKAKLKFTRIDFTSSLLTDIGKKLRKVGFKDKIKQPHMSIERGGVYEPIRQALLHGATTPWNLVLLKVEGLQMVTLATLPLKRKSSQT